MNYRSIALCAAALLGAAALFQSLYAKQSAVAGESVTVRVDVDRTVLPANATEKAIVKIVLDGMKLPRRELRPPVNLALVIDRSGSMGGDKIVKAREAALEAVRRLAPDDLVSVIAYDTRAETLVPAQRRGDGRCVEDAIHRIMPRGSTALYDGVTRGAAEVRRNVEDSQYVNRVILLSDGLANVGPQTPEELARLGASLMKEGISVTTIGLGLGFNEDLMTRLAQRSDGNTYFVEESSDLPNIFAAELGDVLSVVARRVVIEVEFPEGVRPLCFVGREGTIRGRKAELVLNQIYGGQEKYALIEVEIAPAQPGTEREIAIARVRYDDPIRQRATTVTAQRRVEFSSNRTTVIASANHKLQADYAANLLAIAKDEAVTLADAKRNVEAGALLRQRADELNRMGLTYSNRAVQSLAAPAGAEADVLARDGIGNAKRKTYRAESAQIRNQQNTASSSASPETTR